MNTLIRAMRGAVALALTMSAAHAEMQMSMSGALGPYGMSREASGTSWQPDAAPMAGMHEMSGDWMIMLHGYADVVYDRQGGPRGNDKTFVPGMIMAMGQGPAGPGTLGGRIMLSLDPFMGPSGYPLLFQTGETANGTTPLVDRQHPHDLFMELAATYSIPIGEESIFGYAGLPGEPALGPPTFMHRDSGEAIPEAPLSHHWLDSTHISFGVVTLGATAGTWKVDASIFNGHEPDQNRWNIETRQLDSASGRLTWNPSEQWSLQLSHGYLASPEQLEPGIAVHRTTASVIQTLPISGGHWSTTAALGVNRSQGVNRPGVLAESTRRSGPVTLFGRLDWVRTDGLFSAPSAFAGRDFSVVKVSLGGAHDVGHLGSLKFSLGALGSAYEVPSDLRAVYGNQPLSFMVFLRTSIE